MIQLSSGPTDVVVAVNDGGCGAGLLCEVRALRRRSTVSVMSVIRD